MFKIFTMPNCKWCVYAKSLLSDLGFSYEEIETTPEHRAQLVATGVKTLPQIYHTPKGTLIPIHVGGFTELKEYLCTLEDV